MLRPTLSNSSIALWIYFQERMAAPIHFIAAYADTTYHINVEWEETPFLGIFQVEWKVVAADSEQIQTAVVVIMPVIVIVVVVLLLTVIIIWIIIIIRKSKERKARKLA